MPSPWPCSSVRRRRGRVDHHRATGQQAERGGQQQSVLERLLRSVGPSDAPFDAVGPDAFRVYGELRDKGTEVLTALLVGAVLVVGRAGRREQDDSPLARLRRAAGDGALEVARVVQRHAGGSSAARTAGAVSPIRYGPGRSGDAQSRPPLKRPPRTASRHALAGHRRRGGVSSLLTQCEQTRTTPSTRQPNGADRSRRDARGLRQRAAAWYGGREGRRHERREGQAA